MTNLLIVAGLFLCVVAVGAVLVWMHDALEKAWAPKEYER